MTDFAALPAYAEDGAAQVVIETPRHAGAKYKYDPGLGCFVLSRRLRAGLRYPYPWGFIPSTAAADGDPLDAMVLCGLETFAGLVLRCRPLGVLQVAQTENGKTVRNDRVFLAPGGEAGGDDTARQAEALLADRAWRAELEAFFVASTQGTGKRLRFLGWRGAAGARRAIAAAVRAAHKP